MDRYQRLLHRFDDLIFILGAPVRRSLCTEITCTNDAVCSCVHCGALLCLDCLEKHICCPDMVKRHQSHSQNITCMR